MRDKRAKSARRHAWVLTLAGARLGEGPNVPTRDLLGQIETLRSEFEANWKAEETMPSKSDGPLPGSKVADIIEEYRKNPDPKAVAEKIGCKLALVYSSVAYWRERLNLPETPEQKLRRERREFREPPASAEASAGKSPSAAPASDTDKALADIKQMAADAAADAAANIGRAGPMPEPQVEARVRVALEMQAYRLRDLIGDELRAAAARVDPKTASPIELALALQAIQTLCGIDEKVKALETKP